MNTKRSLSPFEEYPYNVVMDMYTDGEEVCQDFLLRHPKSEGGDELLRTNLEELIDVIAKNTASENATRNKMMFFMRYRDRMTFGAIGKVFKCSGSNVRVITSRFIRKLTHPSRSRLLLNDAVEFRTITKEQDERIRRIMSEIEASDDIRDVFRGNERIYNALRRGGFTTLATVHAAGKKRIDGLKGIGAEALNIIMHTMDVRGYDVQSFIEQ